MLRKKVRKLPDQLLGQSLNRHQDKKILKTCNKSVKLDVAQSALVIVTKWWIKSWCSSP